MKEIGGYFELEHFSGQEYYGELLKFNIARNALRYLIWHRAIKKIYLPYLLPESIAKLCEKENCEVELYNVDESFHLLFTKEIEKNEYLYVVNYYGFLSNEYIKKLKKAYKSIILDNVQAFFQKPIPGIDTIYCCRKFFGVPDGAYLATEEKNLNSLPENKVIHHMQHLLGRFEESASKYYQAFSQDEKSFEESGYCSMSKISQNILCGIDYNNVILSRENNYSFLQNQLEKYNGLKYPMPIGPYAYPLLIKNGMEVKKKLAERKIYVPTLWPSVLKSGQKVEISFAENILPIPCDQRYNIDDMKTVCEEVVKCIS